VTVNGEETPFDLSLILSCLFKLNSQSGRTLILEINGKLNLIIFLNYWLYYWGPWGWCRAIFMEGNGASSVREKKKRVRCIEDCGRVAEVRFPYFCHLDSSLSVHVYYTRGVLPVY
jgi:hypothetical protein